ncbi:hypothetical protein [Streptomyces sp. NPDC002602]|uniref:hypothetical protein n=1 Tax=Streptomyces sp. NPDC002602 TaxID=3364654 RepID=UPI0036BE4AAD
MPLSLAAVRREIDRLIRATREWAAAADEYTRDLAQELAAALILDATLARLSVGDPDAERIFLPGRR